jgi:hypothetical protein
VQAALDRHPLGHGRRGGGGRRGAAGGGLGHGGSR